MRSVSCPKCKPNKFVISSATSNHKVDGKPVARDGDMVACGATLIATRDAGTS
ncbi:PAAR domain-containing protein [Roseateles koreensis]|uniref:PAAR domain-containing protein n=1 Tax=Roseateles koreensis TaxID=2987526 RepID=UPI0039648874